MYHEKHMKIVFLTSLFSFNGSIVTLATDRFKAANTFGKLGALTGLNQAMQVVGSILIAPLIKRLVNSIGRSINPRYRRDRDC